MNRIKEEIGGANMPSSSAGPCRERNSQIRNTEYALSSQRKRKYLDEDDDNIDGSGKQDIKFSYGDSGTQGGYRASRWDWRDGLENIRSVKPKTNKNVVSRNQAKITSFFSGSDDVTKPERSKSDPFYLDRNDPILTDEFNKISNRHPPKDGYCHKKEDRQKLHGQECKSCEGYYDSLGLSPESRKSRIDTVSRHRTVEAPPKTPPHYWDIAVPDSQEMIRRGMITEITVPKKSVSYPTVKRLF